MIFIYFYIRGLTKPYGVNRYHQGEKEDVGSLSYNALSGIMMHLVANIVSLIQQVRPVSLKTETGFDTVLIFPICSEAPQSYYYSVPSAKPRLSYNFKKEAGKGDQQYGTVQTKS